MKTNSRIPQVRSHPVRLLPKLLSILVSAVLLGGLQPVAAQSPGPQLHFKAQINHVHIRGGKVVRIPDTVQGQIARTGSAVHHDEDVGEPQYVWDRATRSWMKNPRYGVAKALAGNPTAPGSPLRKRS